MLNEGGVEVALATPPANKMGRREIKRSNTSGSTIKSYDGGSGKFEKITVNKCFIVVCKLENSVMSKCAVVLFVYDGNRYLSAFIRNEYVTVHMHEYR